MPNHYRSKAEQCIDLLEFLLGKTEYSEKVSISELIFRTGLLHRMGKPLVKQLQMKGLIAFEKKGRITFVSKTSTTHQAVQKYRDAVCGLGLS